MTKLTYATALLGALSAVHALPSQQVKREILAPLPENADDIERKFQPFFDFDSDGCYQTAAIDGNGKLNEGKRLGGAVNGQCRDPVQLDNANTYSRRRCNNGVCGILYENYYEKDQTVDGGSVEPTYGHRHDFENVVVFVRGEEVLRVAPSCHGEYTGAKNVADGGVLLDGQHPLMVYHKSAGITHCNRFANEDDRAGVENPRGVFFRAPLVGWLGWPNDGLRDTMNNADWDHASPKTKEGLFADALRLAGAADVGLDINIDA